MPSPSAVHIGARSGASTHSLVPRFFPVFLLVLAAFLVLPLSGCKKPSERRKEQARLDSLKRDTARPVVNPYKQGQGTAQYNRERENLGNLDSLVRPQPATTTPPPRP